jgi:murein hydrolase activator
LSGASTLSKRRPRRPEALFCFALAIALAGAVAMAAPVPHARPKTVHVQKKEPPPPSTDGITDLSRAVPLNALLKQPSTVEQYRDLSGRVAKEKPAVEDARSRSQALARQAAELQHRLVDTAARVEELEAEKIKIDADVARLSDEYALLSASFARDRVQVSRLLAVIERLQHDVPPAMAVRPDDALSAARSAMLIGASLPGIYHDAAALSRRIDRLKKTRIALVQRRSEAARTAASLANARTELDQLLAIKRLEAESAATRYGELKKKLDTIAARANNLQALLEKVAQLSAAPLSQAVVTVNAAAAARQKSGKAWLLPPVVGVFRAGGMDGVGGSAAPGITYSTRPSATVISPADGKIIFASEVPKVGRVLILKTGDVYHVVLAGLERVDVRPGDDVLAGEPVGVMSKFDHEPRLYFELRQNGRGMSPAPYTAVGPRKAK